MTYLTQAVNDLVEKLKLEDVICSVEGIEEDDAMEALRESCKLILDALIDVAIAANMDSAILGEAMMLAAARAKDEAEKTSETAAEHLHRRQYANAVLRATGAGYQIG